jgi:uncharacterized protein (DUF4415 family)
MRKSKPRVDAKGEVRELSTAEIKAMVPARKALPKSLQTKLKFRGPQKSPTKERITIRLSPDVVKTFRATGDGWQTRVDAALKDWLRFRKAAKAP